MWPSVLRSFEQGKVLASYFETVDELVAQRGCGHHTAEEALLELLRTGAVAAPPRPDQVFAEDAAQPARAQARL